MPFPYELYPKAKETHCLNLPEISVSRPPFPGSIRTADGCFWGERDNNSYVSIHQTDQVCAEDNSKCFNQSEVFVDRTVPGVSDTCGQICYAACECNTSNGWYPTCQGTDCYKVVDTRYAGKPNAASASRSLSDVASISASGANSGISASAAAKSGLKTASAAGNYTATAASAGLKTASAVAAATGATSGISTLASGATTCYKKKTCSEGGYYDSVPADQKCSSKSYNGYSCYTGCSYKTCSDYGYNSSIPSGKTCTAVYPRSGLTCYKDCKDESVEVDYYTESRQEYSSAIGQNDNNLYLVIKSDRPADKNYTVNYDGYARFNGGYIPGPYADSHDGACEGSMMNIHSCTLKQGETKVECLLYECPCQNLWWDGTLSPYW